MSQPGGAGAEPWTSPDAPWLKPMRRVARAAVSPDRRFRWYFRMLDTPVVSEMYAHSRGRLRHRRLQARTKIVIEAFPSSGNTFCRQAFLLSNPDVAPNDICSHTHSPRVVERAVRAGVPCIVVAREPRDAVSSMVQRFTGISIQSAFAYYDHYYRKLLPIKDEFVHVPFEAVVRDFSDAVTECNQKYGVQFATNSAAGVSSEMVFADIDRRARDKHDGVIKEDRISRPSATRLSSADFLSGISARQREAMDGAVEAYQLFVDEATPPASA